jgi:hypothetical protein
MYTLSTSLSPGHDLPQLHPVSVRLQSPEELASCHESFITPPDTFYLPTPLALTLSVIIKKKS